MSQRNRTPALLALSLGYFTFGTASLAVVGLNASISTDLHVPVARVGLLVSVFALTFAVAAPLAPWALSRLGRKQVLLLGLGLMALGGLAAAAAPNYGTLCAARVLGALGGGIFGPASSAAGSLIVPEEQRPRALAVVFGGMTAAAVLGVPLASFLGTNLGWRWAIVGISGLTVLALVLVAVLLPSLDRGEPPTLGAYRLVARTRGVTPMVLTTLFFMASQFTIYGVAGAYVSSRFGVSAGTVAVVLLAFGIVGVIGNASGVPLYKRLGGTTTVTIALLGLTVSFLGLIAVPKALAGAVLLFALWAFFSQSFQAPQQARLVSLLPEQRGIVLALNASALNIGVSLGSFSGSTFLPISGARWLSAIGLVPLAMAALVHLRTIGTEPAPTVAPVPQAQPAQEGQPTPASSG